MNKDHTCSGSETLRRREGSKSVEKMLCINTKFLVTGIQKAMQVEQIIRWKEGKKKMWEGPLVHTGISS